MSTYTSLSSLIPTQPIFVLIGTGASVVSGSNIPGSTHWGLLVGTQMWELFANNDDNITISGPKLWNARRQKRFPERYAYGTTAHTVEQVQEQVDSVKAAMGSYDMVWKNCQEFVVNVMRAIRVEKEEWPEYPWAIRGRPRTFAENLALGAQGLENIPFGAYNPPWHV